MRTNEKDIEMKGISNGHPRLNEISGGEERRTDSLKLF